MCHDNSIIPNVYEITHNIKFHISSNKTQDMHTTTQTWQVPQSSQSRTTSTFLHDVSLRSVSNSKFWMPSRTLLSPSSLRDIWQQNEPQTTNRTACKQCYPASAYTQDTTQTQNWSWNLPFQGKSAPSRFTRHIPLLNSRWISELSHVVLLKATSEPRAGKDGQLFSRLHNGRVQMPLALFLGVYPPVLIRPLDLDVP